MSTRGISFWRNRNVVASWQICPSLSTRPVRDMSASTSSLASVALPRRGARRTGASRASATRPVRAAASAVPSPGDRSTPPGDADRAGLGRRGALATAALALAGALAPAARAAEVSVVKDEPGFGGKAAKPGDLLLVNYVATLPDGTMVDTTLGGAKFFTNGNNQSIQPAEARPVIVRVAGTDPVPGIPKGLKQGVQGMKVGGTRVLSVPPELGFGPSAVRSPYADVPGGSTLTYEVTVLRLSDTGPDALFKNVAGCGLGGANTMTNGCEAIVAEE